MLTHVRIQLHVMKWLSGESRDWTSGSSTKAHFKCNTLIEQSVLLDYGCKFLCGLYGLHNYFLLCLY